jgi:hypothetical protein
MIRRGHLPAYRSHVNVDSEVLLRYFLPSGKEPTLPNLQLACRTLHLAFLNQSYDEIYNLLAGMLMRDVRNYDPNYTVKVRMTVAAIASETDVTSEDIFTAQMLNLTFNCDKPLRWMAKKGILESVRDPESKDTRIIGYRAAAWPPKPSLINGRPIGLTYHMQRQFRFYLQDYISDRMREVETRNFGGMQFGHSGGQLHPSSNMENWRMQFRSVGRLALQCRPGDVRRRARCRQDEPEVGDGDKGPLVQEPERVRAAGTLLRSCAGDQLEADRPHLPAEREDPVHDALFSFAGPVRRRLGSSRALTPDTITDLEIRYHVRVEGPEREEIPLQIVRPLP